MRKNFKNPIIVYLNEDLVDEVWAIVKQDGVPSKKTKELEKKFNINMKGKSGNIFKVLIADLSAESSTEMSSKTLIESKFLPLLRLLLLKEIMPDIKDISYDKVQELDITNSNFINIRLSSLYFLSLPSYSDFLILQLLSNLKDYNEPIDIIENYKKLNYNNRTFQFYMLLNNDEQKQIFSQIGQIFQQELHNALTLNKNDLVLGASRIGDNQDPVFTLTICDEKNLRRGPASFTTNQPVEIFGRLATQQICHDKMSLSRYSFKSAKMIGIEPIAISYM